MEGHLASVELQMDILVVGVVVAAGIAADTCFDYLEALEQVQLLAPDFEVALYQVVDNQVVAEVDTGCILYWVLTAVALLEAGTEHW